MESAFWEQVAASGHRVPDAHPLPELTAELTAMLGDPAPRRREAIARRTLTAWVGAGVYDDLMHGLGDGMAAGLDIGIGEDGTDTVFRRSLSAVVLTACLERNNREDLLPAETVLRWGDRIVVWLLRERDLRGFVPGKGWAHPVAHGADALDVLARSEAVGLLELTVLLDVIADRLLLPTTHRLQHGEDDRLARATMQILRRDVIDHEVLVRWLARVGPAARCSGTDVEDPYLVGGNVQSYLRALHLQLALAPDPPPCRTDLLLEVIARLRETNSSSLAR